jgi:prepilin-type N-terminal cleavage/methylation domain-containing protein
MKKGFTLIELLVSISILMLLTGGVLVYFNNFNSRQKIEASRIELIGNLKLARNYAVSRQSAKDGGDLEYVYVNIRDVEGQSKVLAEDQDGEKYFDKFLNEGTPKVFVNDVTGVSFCFEVYSGRTKKYESGSCSTDNIDSDLEIVLQSEAVGETKIVVINSSGLIYEGI